MQDLNPLPWGALDRFQAQFIVKKETGRNYNNYVAKTKLTTKGHFASKSVAKVEWVGSGSLASKLNADMELNEMIAKQSVKDATIYVEPTVKAVRIRSKWDNHIAFGITKELFEIYDKIAGHIKSV
ncbi:MAG: hypothetical protein OEW78_05250 [Nitrosopumilus sp.]|uniref:hypothetical protein n=1 Tax=Nitrosopumilus sp. TaxID=2024843 RepID=UPI00246BBB2D|nr:hypothetical protein [Nitrosopumilus sp.]MDH5431274.1 hypothetical protein [Nitrosopumilus sp.]MDH5697137.1 hypothetical protein [Nitrosopumilus sp.]